MSVAFNNQRDSKHSTNLNLNNGREHLDLLIKRMKQTKCTHQKEKKKKETKERGTQMLPVWLSETKINSLFLIKLTRVQMVSIMFGMKGSGRFGEVEEKLPSIIQATNSCLHIFHSLQETFLKRSNCSKIILSSLEMIK